MSGDSGNGDVYPFNPKAMRSGAPTEEELQKIYGASWDDPQDAQFHIRDWGMDRYVGEAQPIDWLIEDVLPRGVPGLMASLGGIGKSYLLLDLCVRVAAGPGNFGQFALGGSIKSQGRACMITAEESFSAVHRRLDQILNPASKAKLMDRLFLVPLPDTGGSTTFLRQSRGEYLMTPAWFQFCDEVIEMGDVDLVVIDPLQTMVAAELNDPAAAQTFWAHVAKLTAQSGACVLVAHHMRKGGEIVGQFAAREAIRGSGSLVDGCRWVYALWLATNDERTTTSESLGYTVGPLELVHGAVVKSNDIGVGEQRTYLRDVESGLLEDKTEQLRLEIHAAQQISDEQKKEVLDEVSRRWELARPYSSHPNARDRWIGRFMVERFSVTRATAREFVRKWMDEGFLVKDWHSTARINGLRVG